MCEVLLAPVCGSPSLSVLLGLWPFVHLLSLHAQTFYKAVRLPQSPHDTWHLCLQGILLEACPQSVRASSLHLTTLQGWEELALVVESAIAGRSKEVALAALACITGLVAAQGPACPPLVWRRSLRALGVGIEAATSPLCLVPLQVHLCLLLASRCIFAGQRFLPPYGSEHSLPLLTRMACLSNITAGLAALSRIKAQG